MELKDTLNNLSHLMKEVEISTLFGSKYKLVDKTIHGILEDIDLLDADKAPNASKEKEHDIMEVIRLLKDVLSRQIITTQLSTFLNDYLLLVDNWNQNVLKNQLLTAEILFIRQYKEYHFTTIDLLKIVKQQAIRFEQIKHFALPTIELSRHYFESFEAKRKNPEEFANITHVGTKFKSDGTKFKSKKVTEKKVVEEKAPENKVHIPDHIKNARIHDAPEVAEEENLPKYNIGNLNFDTTIKCE